MISMLALFLIIIFSILGLIHVYWGLGNREGWTAAIPEVGGQLAFEPSAAITYLVATGLLLCGLLVSMRAGFLVIPLIPAGIIQKLMYALALVLLLRAIGDFKLVGFFKRVRDTQFARLDTRFYSPLCLLLAIGVCAVALA